MLERLWVVLAKKRRRPRIECWAEPGSESENFRDCPRLQSCPQQPRALLITIRGIASPIEASFLLPCLLFIMLEPARLLALGLLLSLLSTTEGQATQDVSSQNTKLSNESLLWGPYRPNLYFGVRPRIPKSLMTGLLWAKVDSFQGVQNSTF